MGLAILILLIGIPIGLFMLLKPTVVNLRVVEIPNPEANEPSDVSYGLAALRGVGIIVAVIILALLAATKPNNQHGTTAT